MQSARSYLLECALLVIALAVATLGTPSALLASSPAAAKAVCPYPSMPKYSSNPTNTPAAYRAEVIRLVNQERAKYALPALATSSTLSKAALRHSQDMSQNNFFGHVGSDGSNVGDRAQAAGYPSQFVGENIDAGDPTPADAVSSWMTGERQCATILDPTSHAAGVGYVFDPDDKPLGGPNDPLTLKHYWTLLVGDVVDTTHGELPRTITFMRTLGSAQPGSYSLHDYSYEGSWQLQGNAAWLQFSPGQGSGILAVELRASAAGLATGSYSTTLNVTDNAASTQKVTSIAVRLIVSPEINQRYLPLVGN